MLQWLGELAGAGEGSLDWHVGWAGALNRSGEHLSLG
jgi:hypothetical protein